MKKQNYCTVVICMFTFLVIVCTLQTRANRIISSDISLNEIEILSSNESGLDCSSCNVSGGKGAASCACTGGSITVGGVGGGGASCDVSVFPGYYACCYKDAKGICRCPSCKDSDSSIQQ